MVPIKDVLDVTKLAVTVIIKTVYANLPVMVRNGGYIIA